MVTDIYFSDNPDIDYQGQDDEELTHINSILVPKSPVNQLVDDWFIDELDADSRHISDDNTEFINLSGHTLKVRGKYRKNAYRRSYLKLFPAAKTSACLGKQAIRHLPNPKPGKIYIVNEPVLKFLLIHQDEPGARPIDDLAYRFELIDTIFYPESVDICKFIISARALRVAPYKGSAFSVRFETLRHQCESFAPLSDNNLFGFGPLPPGIIGFPFRGFRF